MVRDILANLDVAKPQVRDILAETEDPIDNIKENRVVYLEDRDETVSYPAGTPLDQVNSMIQKQIYQKPPLNFYDLPVAVGAIVGEEIAKEGIAKTASELGKQGVRSAEGLAAGVGSVVRWYGNIIENDADKDFRFDHINASLVRDFKNRPKSEGFAEFERGIGERIGKWGGAVKEFFDEQQQTGFEAPDPEIFAGSFMDNPSWIRGSCLVMDGIVSLGAATAVTFATKSPTAGAAMLGLLEGSGTYDEAIAAGKTVDEATGLGGMSVVGLTILERIPLTRFLRGGGKGRGVRKLTKDIFVGMSQEGGEEVAQALWQNSIAKLGYDKTRQLTEGMVESLIAGAGSGGMMGGITSGRGKQIDRLVKEALEKGVTEAEIEQMRDAVRNGLVHNKDEINTLLDKSAKKVKKVNEEKAAEQVADLLAKTEERPTYILYKDRKVQVNSKKIYHSILEEISRKRYPVKNPG